MPYQKLKPEVKERWVKALRSGNYKQGVGKLCKENTYCCLGVLCEVQIEAEDDTLLKKTENRVARRYVFTNPSGNKNISGNTIPLHWLEAKAKGPVNLDEIQRISNLLVRMNDDEKLGFPKIADWIELHL